MSKFDQRIPAFSFTKASPSNDSSGDSGGAIWTGFEQTQQSILHNGLEQSEENFIRTTMSQASENGKKLTSVRSSLSTTKKLMNNSFDSTLVQQPLDEEEEEYEQDSGFVLSYNGAVGSGSGSAGSGRTSGSSKVHFKNQDAILIEETKSNDAESEGRNTFAKEQEKVASE